ncbi:MAG: glycosyltransferase family 4 protein [Candidatus Omnitrophota bacterium]
MNILILSTHCHTGGIASYILTLTKSLLSRGHRVIVVSSGGDRVNDLIAMGARHQTFALRTKSELNPRLYLSLKKLRELIRNEKIDIIHAHTRVTQVIGFFLQKMSQKPCVCTCHGFFKPRLSRKIFPCWGNRTIAISEAVRRHLEKDFHVPKDKIDLIPNGIDLDEFRLIDEKTKEDRRKEFHLDQGPVIGIIARLSDVKGHDILISAMKHIVQEIPQARLMIIGEGKREDLLKQMTKELGLAQNISFYPIVNKTAWILPIFDIFVMPSIQEGLGLSVMEAQAVGLPVVASRVGGIPSLIQDNETGVLVSSKDPKELGRAVIALLKDPIRAKKIGESARLFIQKEFSAEKMVEKTIACYQKAMGEHE